MSLEPLDDHMVSTWIKDSTGREYEVTRVESGDSCDWFIAFGNRQIGHAYSTREGAFVCLRDIVIYDDVLPTSHWLIQSVKDWLGLELKPINLRGKGLGSDLLRSVIEWATQKKFAAVFGEIYPRDFNRNPNLPRWYGRHGFTFERYAEGSEKIGKVTLHL